MTVKNIFKNDTSSSILGIPALGGLLVVLIIALLAFTPGISTIPPIDRDEARFAQSSKQMLASGDFVTPRFQQQLRAKKPPAIYWMQAVAAANFGVDTITSFRLPSLAGALALSVAGFYFARRLIPPFEALIAGIFIASSLVLVAEAHLAKTDAMLVAFILIQQSTLWQIYRYHTNAEYISGRLALAFWGAMAIGILLKGPIAPVIAILTIIALCFRERNLSLIVATRLALGIVVLTILVVPWVLLVSYATDGAFIKTALNEDFISKIKSGQESHGAPPLTHLALLIVTFWPGSLLLMRGVIAVFRNRHKREIAFLLGWLVPFWLLIELTPTKLPHYFMPVMPALAILVALGAKSEPQDTTYKPIIKRDESRYRFWLRYLGYMRVPGVLVFCWEALFIIASLCIGVFVLYVATNLGGSRGAATLALILSIMVAGLGYWWTRSQRPAILIMMVVAAVGFHGITFGKVIPSLQDMHLAPRLKTAVAELTPPVEIIVAAGYHEPSMIFTLGTETLLFTASEAALFLGEAPDGLALIESRAEGDFIAAAAKAGVRVEKVKSIKGYNISRAQKIEIDFYRGAN